MGAGRRDLREEVEPFELMKLRLLNGSHSTLAYLGYLSGHETVADAMAAPGFAELLKAMMREEVTPTLPSLPGFDLTAYRAALLERFRNPACAIALGRSPWTARRSCRSGFSARSATG